ncbi:MAG: D-2-hydroxyacid dehydrogenase [Clostridia bacterium]|nr:D-2-hydroxyacid dehydrogenase [Clostridia bacterium]
MSRKLIVAIGGLLPAHRDAIRAAAEPEGFDVTFHKNPAEAMPDAADAEIIFGNAPELARVAPKLRWLCTPSAGYDHYAGTGVFASPEAMLSNSSGAYGVTIAEHVVMMTLELMRCQQDYSGVVERREWVRNLPVRSICGSCVAVLGTGDLGRTIARRLRGFEPARIVGVNRSGHNPGNLFDEARPIADLDDVLPGCDLLIMSLPGAPETRHILDGRRLALLPDGAIIVNVGRGTSIDEEALLIELRSGRIRAGLDVFEVEPLPQDSPLWACPNLLITPHAAGNLTLPYTVDRIVALFLEDFGRYCKGEPLKRRVDPNK